MQCQTNTATHIARTLPMGMVFMLLCGQTHGWLWPLVGYSALLWSCYRPATHCSGHRFWWIAAAGFAFLLLALTLKDRWQLVL